MEAVAAGLADDLNNIGTAWRICAKACIEIGNSAVWSWFHVGDLRSLVAQHRCRPAPSRVICKLP